MAGVRLPDAQTKEPPTGQPMMTVNHMVETKIFAVQIIDEEGRPVNTVAYKIGETWWTDPQGEAWARTLMKARPKLAANLDQKFMEQESYPGVEGTPKTVSMTPMKPKLEE
jgi:hypothetical protein